MLSHTNRHDIAIYVTYALRIYTVSIEVSNTRAYLKKKKKRN